VTAAGRVLMVAPQPFFRVTGTPISILAMCRALTESGYAVELWTLPHGEPVALDRLRVRRVPRLPLVRGVPVGFSPAKLAYNLLLAGAVLLRLLRERFAVVHAVEEAAFYAVPLARLRGVPAITDLDSDLVQQLRESASPLARALARPAARLRRTALRRSAAALAVAGHMRALARAERPDLPVFEIRDIPLEETLRPPDPARMAALRRELGLEGRRLLVYTGNYDRRQGLEALVRAMAAVTARQPAALLLVVGGDAAEGRALEALAGRLGAGDAVRPIGRRPPETMAEFMGLAEVLVSPRLEPHATPLKIFSYMASGRPIVATDLPTHTEVLAADAAFLVPPTAAGLAAGILAALERPEEAAARGARARRLVLERHTYARFRDELAAAYRAILAAARLAAP